MHMWKSKYCKISDIFKEYLNYKRELYQILRKVYLNKFFCKRILKKE